MNDGPDLFPGFGHHNINTAAGPIFARVGGSGPPLLCLHGFPQTHACWHHLAAPLAAQFTVVVADLRGYGASCVPASSGGDGYTKRAMAADNIELMNALGFPRFSLLGHDRGARVGYRLALDHPDRIERLAVLDILPTGDVWSRLTAPSVIASYHWQFLARPEPFPETMIGAAARYYCDATLVSWTKCRTLDAFDPRALAAYRTMFDAPERIRAMCEDYRAGATADREADDADLSASRRIRCPVLALWGTDYVGKGSANPLTVWERWCASLEGAEISAGHFIAEENPAETLRAVLPFFRATSQTRRS